MNTTIDSFALGSFEERPVLVTETPYGRRYWLECDEDDRWYACDDTTRLPVSGDASADQVTCDWLTVVYDLPAEVLARCGAGVTIGQCTGCDAWLVMPEDDRDAGAHDEGCPLLLPA